MAAEWNGSLLSLLPTLLLLGSAFSGLGVAASLSLGLISAVVIAAIKLHAPAWSILGHATAVALDLEEGHNFAASLLSSDTLKLFSSLVLLGAIISLAARTGILDSYIEFISRVGGSRETERKIGFFSSLAFFIDEYLGITASALSSKRVSRRTGRSMIDSLSIILLVSVPIVAITPISTWGGFITAQIETVIDAVKTSGSAITSALSPFSVLLHSIPFSTASLTSLIVAGYLVFAGRTRTKEKEKEEKGLPDDMNPRGPWFLLPLIILIDVSAVLAQVIAGKPVIPSMLRANLLAYLLIYTLSLVLTGRSSKSKFLISLGDGLKDMLRPMVIISIAWTLAAVLNGPLHLGTFLSRYVGSLIPAWALPIAFYLLTVLTGVSIVSSWGAMSVILPVAIPAALGNSSLLFATVGAVISGAQISNLLSPVSDIMALAAGSGGVRQWVLSSTIRPTVALIAAASALGILLSSFLLSLHVPWLISPLVGLLSSAGISIAVMHFFMTEKI